MFYQGLAKYEPGKDYLLLSFEKIPPQEILQSVKPTENHKFSLANFYLN